MSKRTQITLSDEDHRLLTWWAKCHGRSAAAQAGNIVAARLEANLAVIKELLEHCADMRGISVEQLKQEWQSDTEDSE